MNGLRLLLDHNLSKSLIDLLGREFPGVPHVASHGLERADDHVIWEFAKDRGYVSVSKDSDFMQRSPVSGSRRR